MLHACLQNDCLQCLCFMKRTRAGIRRAILQNISKNLGDEGRSGRADRTLRAPTGEVSIENWGAVAASGCLSIFGIFHVDRSAIAVMSLLASRAGRL